MHIEIPPQSRPQNVNNLEKFTTECSFEISLQENKTYAFECFSERLDVKVCCKSGTTYFFVHPKGFFFYRTTIRTGLYTACLQNKRLAPSQL